MQTSFSVDPTSPEQPPASSFQLPALRGIDYLLALAVCLLAAALYLRTLAPGVLGGDSGEFQFAAWLGGFAHPTGYPLYLLLGHLWSHLIPLHDPAWRMNAYSALWAGVAVGLLYLLALRVLHQTDSWFGGFSRLLARQRDGLEPPDRSIEPPAQNLTSGSTTAFRQAQGTSPARCGNCARLSALLTAATLAVTPTFWSQAVVAEVYTLNAALTLAFLLCLVIWAAQPPDRRSMRPLYAAALIFGLGLAHHRTIVLWLPAVALFLWINRRMADDRRPPTDDRRQHRTAGLSIARSLGHLVTSSLTQARLGRHLVTLVLLILAPLALYLYIPLVAAHAPYRQVSVGAETLDLYSLTVAGFVRHVTGSEFGAEFRAPAAALAQVIPSLGLLRRELTPAGIALGLIGLAWLVRLAWRPRPTPIIPAQAGIQHDARTERESHPPVIPAQAGIQNDERAYPARALLTLTGVGFLTLFAFNLFYGIGDIAAYYTPLYALWCLWIAFGVVGVVSVCEKTIARLSRQFRFSFSFSPAPPLPHSLRLLAFLLPAHLLLTGFAAADQSGNNRARAFWDALLAEPIPQGAILVTNDRDEMMPFWYARYVEGTRPDVTGLFPLIQPDAAWSDVVAVTESALPSGRPVLLIKEMPGLEIKFAMQAAGKLVKVRGPAVEGPPARPADLRFGDANAGDAVRLLGYDIAPAMLAPGRSVTITLRWQPVRPLSRDYTTFVHLVNADGAVIGASDHRPGGVYYPSSQWKADETLADTHVIPTSPDLGRPAYAVEVGIYTGSGELRHLGQPQWAGMVGRERPPDAIPAGLPRLNAIFGDQIGLAGYRSELQGDRLALTLYWQALAPPAADYTVFVHVLDGNGKIVAQYDGQPLGGDLPTRAWPPGYTVADAITIPLPSTLAPGTYRLAAGLYDAASGVRLPISGAAGGDAVSLGEFSW